MFRRNGFGRQREAWLGGQVRSACNIMTADDGLDELITFLRNDRREVTLELAKVVDGCFALSDLLRICTQTSVYICRCVRWPLI